MDAELEPGGLKFNAPCRRGGAKFFRSECCSNGTVPEDPKCGGIL